MVPSQTFKLLDLPDAAISVIIAGLTVSDKRMIMAACRRTFDMTMLSAAITVKVAMGSKFSGFRKVLNLVLPASIHLEITCPAGRSKNLNALHHVPLSTMAVLMGMVPDNTLVQAAASCQGKAWHRITKVTIKGTMMSCLVPRFLALTCPKLMQLKIKRPYCLAKDTYLDIFHSNPDQASPLTLCTSLKHLEIDSYRPNLPSSYHSPAELRQNLPNIDTLVFEENHNASLIQAFASQLTRLEIHRYGHDINEVQQAIRQVSNLQHLCIPQLVLPFNTASLTTLELSRYVTDAHVQLLLQLSSLAELRLPELRIIQQDWSHRACPWQQLHLSGSLHFTTLGKLNFSSLKRLSVGADVAIHLPDPSGPSSLRVVQHIAASLSHTQLEVEQNKTKKRVHFEKPDAMRWDIRDCGSEHEQNAAELIRTAAQRVGPFKACNCEALKGRPLPLVAVLEWGKSFIESVYLGKIYNPQPFVWQALQGLDKIHTVEFWTPPNYGRNLLAIGHTPNEPDEDDEKVNISNAICSAAQHYVIPANRSLRIEHGFSISTVERAAATDFRTILCAAIMKVLPAGCRLASFEYTCMEGNSYSSLVDAYCVAIVEPLTPTS